MQKKKVKNGYKHWTKEDVFYLSESYGKIETKKIAKKLGRTELAVKRKAEKLFTTRKRNQFEGYLTTSELGEILGVHKSTVARWIREHNFPCMVHNKNDVSGNTLNKYTFTINPDDVWKWVEINRDKMNIYASQIQLGAILPEPKWLHEDIEKNVWYGRHERWTTEMHKQLYNYYYKEDLKIREIAEKMGKTMPAIQKQLKKIRDKGFKIA